jgi:CRP/FNR family transcriptional regulator
MTSHELTLAQDRMMVLGKMNASERVAKFILNISDQRLRIGWQNNPISIPMTRQDIADYLGLTLETISREFTKLKSTNTIKFLTPKQIYIIDKDKLSSVCN